MNDYKGRGPADVCLSRSVRNCKSQNLSQAYLTPSILLSATHLAGSDVGDTVLRLHITGHASPLADLYAQGLGELRLLHLMAIQKKWTHLARLT